MKYIIEIENEPFGRNDDPVIPHGMDKLYRAKGFKSLVFDKNGLDKLISYTEPDRKAIEDEVWEFAREMISTSGHEVSEMWGCVTNFGEVMHNTTYQEAKAKYEAWLKKKDEILVGDEVEYPPNKAKGIVIRCHVPDVYAEVDKYAVFTGTFVEYLQREWLTKTGRVFPEVAELLERMRGDKE